MYAWGRGIFGEEQTTPTLVDTLKGSKIKAVQCGVYHALALTEEGKLLSWGTQNGDCQLGRAAANAGAAIVPAEVEGLSGVTCISAERTHSLAVASDGVYGWGLGRCGVLGNGSAETAVKPTKVMGTAGGAKSVSTGWTHSVFLSGMPYQTHGHALA